MLSTFFSSRYIRWNGNFGVEHCLRAHLLFHVHRDFLSPNEIFSLWRNKIRDLLSTTELYFESNGNAPFQFINSSKNAMQQLSILWTRGRQSLLNFFTNESIEEIENLCLFLIIIYTKLKNNNISETFGTRFFDTLCTWYFSTLKKFSRENYHRIGMQMEAKVHLTFKTFGVSSHGQ